MVKISIITITYNSEDKVERAIKSVVEQNYPNLEYIIIDGRSTDNTLAIVEKYKDHIAKVISEPDDGISDAFDKGIALATGKIIGIVNSDDGLMPNALKIVNSAYDENVDIYRGKCLLWKEDSNTKVVEKPSMHFTYSVFDRISHQSTFVTKKAYERYGNYDRKCEYDMDWDFLMRAEKKGATFKFIDEVLAFYSLGGLTATKFTPARRKEAEYVFRKNGANGIDIFRYRIEQSAVNILKKIIPKEMRLNMRHKKYEV